MKLFLFRATTLSACLLTLLILAPLSVVQAQDTLYGKRIIAPSKPGRALAAAIEDFSRVLEQITGEPFAVSTEPNTTAIELALTSAPQVPADAKQELHRQGAEAFLLRLQAPSKLWIVANDERGLSHGMYYYLEQLGCRFYFPSDKWTIIPARKDITLKIDRLMKPDFRIRTFFGTGGFGGELPLDPEMKVQARWRTWQRRNRFGAEFGVGGHYGEAFNTKHKETLLKHPEYLAKVDGKHVPWSVGAKLNVANADAVKLYVNDRLEEVRERSKDPNEALPITISVDPADGGGHCNSEECKAIGNGSVSDQVFYLANEVAKAVGKEFPDVLVTLYAYNQHAAVPSFPLEKNIYVEIIPYAFHSKFTEMSPQELIAVWGKKVDRMSVYDYWQIPDWSKDMPFEFLAKARPKLQYWHDNNIQGFSSESTFSSGAVGITWYLASRMMWDMKTDERALLEEFYELSFGPAKAPMKRMIERWGTGFMLGEQELGVSFRDLQAALKLAEGNPAVQARVDDYVRYVQYLRMWHEYEESKYQGLESQREAARKLIELSWGIYYSSMIHTFRLQQNLLNARIFDNEFFDLKTRYLWHDPKAPGWKVIHPPTHEQLVQMVEDGVRSFEPLDFALRSYSGKLVPLVEPTGGETKFSPVFVFQGTTEFDVRVPADMKILPIRIEGKNPVQIELFDADGNSVFEQPLEPSGDIEPFSMPIPRPGEYRLRISKGRFVIQFPSGLPIILRTFYNVGGRPMANLYFYVPKGLKSVAFKTIDRGETTLFDSEGRKVPHKEGAMIIAAVPPGQDGKVWSVTGLLAANGPITALNVPQVFSFFPNTLLVPEDALK